MARITAQQAGGQNRIALLDTIAWSEIGPALLTASDDGYNVLVGSTPAHPLLFSSYAAPPNVFNAALNSTAAGRYQTLHRYAAAYIAQLKLPDFGPVSQDRIALQQIGECHALTLVDAGHFAAAIAACSSRWASLPGNNYGQRTNEMAALQAAYVAAGGTVSA